MRTQRAWIAGLVMAGLATGWAAEAQGQSTPIKIGQVVPLTGGSAAVMGRFEKQGAELAVEMVNAGGGINGRMLTLVQADDQSTNLGAVAALQKLLEDKEIPLIVGPIFSGQVQAMLPTINEAKIPVAIGATAYSLTHSGSQWMFRFRPHDGISAKVIAKFLVEELKVTKVTLVYSSEPFGIGGRDLVTAALRDLGVEVVVTQGFTVGEKDFTAVIEALKKSGPPALVTYMNLPADLGLFARQLKERGAQVTWIGSPSIFNPESRTLAGEALYGTYGVTEFHGDASPTARSLATAFKAKYGQEANAAAAWCYDALRVFAEAMIKAPDLKPENLRQAILGIQKFPGAEGEYNFDGNGDGLDSYHVMQNEQGTLKLLKTVLVAR
jgi:branched-chain amino acid transport system substrate-binding protein